MALTKLDKNLLGFSDDTDFIKLPSGTTAQRPGSPAAGQFRFNTTLSDVEVYDGTAWVRMGTVPPTYSSVDYPGDDTALDPVGGQSLIINGSAFNTGITLTIDGTTPSSITRNSSAQLTVTTPAKSAGTYTIVFTNTDGGTATATNVVSYNGIPTFTNAAGSLGSAQTGASVSLSAVATEPDGGAIGYTITSGALPSGISLNASTGAITGTAPTVSADTIYSFTVTATDNENQSTARAYTITITPKLPSDSFNIKLYTGNGSSQSLTGVGFKPDIIWVKQRNDGNPFAVYDSSRGAGKLIRFDNYEAESGNSGNLLASFDADGFSVNRNYLSHTAYDTTNHSGSTYTAMCWKVNGGTTSSNTLGEITSEVQVNDGAGVSIVRFAGIADPGDHRSFGHGLSAEPELIIMKRREANQHPAVFAKISGGWEYFDGMTSTDGGGDYDSGITVTSTLIDIDDHAEWFADSSHNYVYWCWRSVAGYSKISSYTGNGSSNGPIIETGFEPAFLMIKRVSGADNWVIFDNKRDTTNPREKMHQVNLAATESTEAGAKVDFLSNGFQLAGTGGGAGTGQTNSDGDTYLYMAFAADPDTTTPTLADSFGVKAYSGTGSNQSITGYGFAPNSLWIKQRSGTEHPYAYDTIRGYSKYLHPTLAHAEGTDTSSRLASFDADGFSLFTDGSVNGSGSTYVAWAWKGNDEVPTLTEQGITDSDTILTYRFENDNTDDSTGTYNGTASNISFTGGKFGNSVEFNGSSSQIVNSSFTRTQNYTVSLWLNTDTSSGELMAIALNWSAGTGRVAIGIKDGGIKYQDGNSSWLTILGSVSTNTWYHVAITYDHASTTAKAYLNGSEVVSTSVTVAVPSTGGGLYLGQFGSSAGYWDGEVSRVRIYNSALGSSDITALYNESIKAVVSANVNAGFSIVKYTDATAPVPHGLSAVPKIIIQKKTSASEDWYVYFPPGFIDSNYNYMVLNSTAASGTTSSTAPTATTFNAVSDSGSYIAYVFHEVTGFSKFGTYDGTGTSSRSFTGIGFQPDFVMVKCSSATAGWHVYDSARGAKKRLKFNDSGAEYDEASSGSAGLNSFDSDGWTIGNDGDHNGSGKKFIYAAFKIN